MKKSTSIKLRAVFMAVFLIVIFTYFGFQHVYAENLDFPNGSVDEEKTYSEDSSNAPGLQNLWADGADFYTPLDISSKEQYLVMRKNIDECSIIFVPGRNVQKVYLTDEDNNIVQTAFARQGNVHAFNIKEEDFGDSITLKRNLVLESKNGLSQEILFTVARRNKEIDSPDKLVEYLCVGSQYSDGGNRLTGIYGLYPEKSLIGLGYWWSPISLGNFGGHATYYYEEPIKDAPNNPYGIDFIVYGNSNGGPGFSEPGSVLVSENGEDWYVLAGSEHYENRTKWDYRVTYTKTEKGTKANSIELGYMYPSIESYPLYDWSRSENNITVEGVAIGNGITAYYPAFGYADVRTNSGDSWGTGEKASINGIAKNPYLETTAKQGLIGPDDADKLYEGAGDCFDLAWAVDKDGLPVKLPYIHYIKVQTAQPVTLITGAIGEKSTEVNVVARVLSSSSDVGISSPPEVITVGGKELDLEHGKYIYNAEASGVFDVNVEASAANVYINNYRGSSRTFAVSPNKNIIRIIVQDGQKAPLIYYINIRHTSFTKDDIAEALGGTEAQQPVIRKDVISAMYKLCGQPETKAADSERKYGSDDIEWAVGKGLIIGDGRNLLLEKNITREELSKILFIFANMEGSGQINDDDISAYSDYKDISNWATEYMRWANGTGAITPGNDNTIDPKGVVTCSEMIEILYRMVTGKY